jgi:hypothetical protein
MDLHLFQLDIFDSKSRIQVECTVSRGKGEERKVLSRHDEVVNNLECILASSAAKYYKRHRYNNADQGVQQKE